MMRTQAAVLTFFSILAATISARATDVMYDAPKSQTTVLPGAWGAVSPTTVSNPQSEGDFYNDGSNFSYPVILDTGSSGMLMSWTVQNAFGVPLTSDTYQDVGIGGNETFNVTEPIRSYLAPTNLNADTPANFTAYGTYNYQAKQESLLEDLGVFYDIVGTPVLNHYVMHVLPNHVADLVSDGGVANLAETHLMNTAPVVPAQGVYRIPLTYQNFVDGTPAVSTSTNPIIQGVKASAGTNSAGFTSDWLLDTGASVSIVTPALAEQIGIDTNSEPAIQIQIFGVGDQIVTMDGYELNSLSLPLTTGDHLVFNNPIVFVPETNNLPSSLTGVLGMNLLDPSFDTLDQSTGQPLDQIPSLFSDFYVDSGANQLILVDPNSTYVPEPAGAMMLVGLACLATVRRRSRSEP